MKFCETLMSKRRPSWNDPHAERESAKYEHPVPSRELIQEVLSAAPRGLTHEQIGHHFGLHDDAESVEALRRRLIAMVRDGQLLCNRRGAYTPLTETARWLGTVRAHPDGFGFLILDEGGEDMLLVSREMRQVFDGDRVEVREGGYDHKGRREAIILRVIERHTQHLVGRYYEEEGRGFVVPDHRRLCHEVSIEGDTRGAEHGQFVEVDIVRQPSHREPPLGVITSVLGDYMAPGMEIDIALRSFDIPHVWPAAVEKEVARWHEEIDARDAAGRVDLRDMPLVTIDGEDAKDFDDAIHVSKRRFGAGYRLIVAIADVSHYVRPGTALDDEAQRRGTSVYFPGHVVPMLPEILSNGLCSLKPEVDRLCMVCDMNISRAGRISAYKFYPAVMHSRARLTYRQVEALLTAPDSPDAAPFRERWKDLVPALRTAHELYGVLRAAREQRGALDFDAPETRILFSADRKIERILPVQRHDAHKLIEECMLAANVCAAAWALKQRLPVLYRNHQGPRDEKLTRLRAFLAPLGLVLPAIEHPQPKDFHALLEKIQGRPDRQVIETMLLRSLSQAFYGPENLGHFGLHYGAYAHFTSPIRRYPDLLLHRALRAHAESDTATLTALSAQLPALGEHCSMTERRADEATRDVMAWLKCEYMSAHIGEDYAGIISAVTAFGIFVELSDVFVEGLVHISHLGADYYVYDAQTQSLRGESSGLGYALGDAVQVRVAGVDLDQRKIDFQLLSQARGRQARTASRRRT